MNRMSFVSADKIISVAWVLDNPTTPTSVTFTVSCGTTAIPCNGWFSVALLPPGAKAHQVCTHYNYIKRDLTNFVT